MKKFLIYLFISLMIGAILLEGIFLGITTQKKGVFHSSYQSMIVDKYRMLEKTPSPKIIMVAGSSSSFGLDQNLLEEASGLPVVNLGLHAGFGSLFYSELAKENIQPGDIVLLGYEYSWIDDFDPMDQELIMSAVDEHIDLYKHIPVSHWPDFLGYLFQYAEKKNTFEGADGLYSRDSFDPENGQMTYFRPEVFSNYAGNVANYGTVSVEDDQENITISDTSLCYLRDFKKYIEDRGAKAYFVSSPVYDESLDYSAEDFVKLARLEEKQIGIPYISDPLLYVFQKDLMLNSINHCNSEGEKIRTCILIDDLKRAGIIPQEPYSETVRRSIGETFALVGILPKRFLNKPVSVEKVYLKKENGETVEYTEGTDYTVDYDRGTIRRTEDSAIPDYSEHWVRFTRGRFDRYEEDGKTNPESNRPYQICVDYRYQVKEKALTAFEDQSDFLSESLKEKLTRGESVRISLVGDSIGLGTDTDGIGIFLNYLREALSSHFGAKIVTDNLSQAGGDISLLAQSTGRLLQEKPDLVIIELGMNDHSAPEAETEEKREAFRNQMEESVRALKENGTDVILMGFFQRNMSFTGENTGETIPYNEIIRETAEKNQVYFADIYRLYDLLDRRKQLTTDVLADYLHHPAEWGHQLYFSSLLPVFNIGGRIDPSDFPRFLTVE